MDRAFEKIKFLRHPWKKFRDGFVERHINSNVYIYYTTPPSHFFDLNQTRLHTTWLRHLPPLFIGIGLLLTFTGLAAGLKFATQSLSGGDIGQLQEALGGLLHAASVKFITSIAGLVCALLTTVIYHATLRWLRNTLADLCVAMEGVLQPLVPEQIGEDQTRLLEEQANQLKKFTSEMAITLGQSLEKALRDVVPGIMENAMQPVVAGVTALNRDLGNSVGDVVREQTGDQFNHLGRTLQTLSEAMSGSGRDLREAAEGFRDLSQGMQQNMAGSMQRMEQASTHAAERFEKVFAQAVDQFATAVTTNARSMESAATALNGVAQNSATSLQSGIQGAVTALAEAMGKIQDHVLHMSDGLASVPKQAGEELGQHMAKFLEETQKLTAEVRESTVKNVKNISAIVSVVQTRLEEVSGNIGRNGEASANRILAASEGLTDRISRVLEEMQRHTVENSEKIGGAVGSLRDAIQETTHTMHAVESRIEKHVKGLENIYELSTRTQEAMRGAARDIGQATAPWAETGKTIAAGVSQAGQQTREAATLLNGVQGQAQQLAKDLSQTLQALSHVWEIYDKRFEDVDKNLEQVMTTLLKQVGSVTDAMKKYTNEIDANMGNAVNKLGSSVGELGEIAEALNEAIGKLRPNQSRQEAVSKTR
ncbi:MAG: hypothetical protein H7833_03740 [Magnetococcus sp. DMHC-1]|nr:hypothetical protein [Magnetococcales bacterium]